HIDLPQNVDRSGWRIGRRIVEVGFLLEQLQYYCECRLGPVPLTFDNVVGELKKGLGGYLYVRCQNHDCLAINRVPYGKTHRVKKRGMPCFAANTKLGTGREKSQSRKRLSVLFPCKTRHGMSCSLWTLHGKTHTFFMSRAKYGKKVVKSVVCHRTCGTCIWWRRNKPGKPVRSHRCVQNHTGSARLMESVSGQICVQELNSGGTPVEILEGDGDNNLISRLKTNLNLEMKKRFDKNHVVKNIGKHLRTLQSEKGLKLSVNTITHISNCVSYAFSKHQGDKVGIEDNLKAIIPHNFGDHTLCQDRFCGYKRKPGEKYLHRSLPYKGPLKCDKLHIGSSQQCEHANREVALRALKSLHYGNSEALDFRVHAIAAFINEGRAYIPQMNVEAGLSPEEHTVQYAQKCALKRKHCQQRSQLPSTKRRDRCVTQAAHEALEGASYQSGIGHEEHVDTEKLSDPVPRGVFKPVTVPSGSPSYVIFDLETTELIRGGQMPHITQLAAVELSSGQTFNCYILPEISISDNSQQVTGISMVGDREMMVDGRPLTPSSWKSASIDFLNWLKKHENAFLVAHNGRRFDFPVIMSAYTNVH
ncbi:hypothetical protein MAR_038332, partial [Mya arenaria]